MGTNEYGLRAAAGKMYFNTGGNYIFNSTGANMGIGVILPAEKLEVAGNIKQSAGYQVSTDKVQATGTEGLRLYNHNSTGIFVSPDGNIGIGISNTPYRLTVNGTIFTNSDAYIAGDVGIGTDSPQEKLHVDGNQLITGSLDVNGTVNAGSFSGDGSGLTNVDDGDWIINGNDMYNDNSGYVGIGTDAPEAKFHVVDGSSELKYNIGDLYLKSSSFSPSVRLMTIPGNNVWDIEHVYNGSALGQFIIRANGNTKLAINESGQVGIGINPSATLDVNGNLKVHNNILLNGNWLSGDGDNQGVFIDNFGKVGIGNSSPDAELDVNGNIICGAIEVTDLGEWKDCVFDEDYNLPTLQETEEFIKENHHLPDIPSEAEVIENGINVGEMNALLLQKIEELTLYMIELEKEINELKKD